MMEDKIFGDSGSRVVVEEFLTGPEVSVLAFTDGETVKPMVSSMDHKRAYDAIKAPIQAGWAPLARTPITRRKSPRAAWRRFFCRPFGQCGRRGGLSRAACISADAYASWAEGHRIQRPLWGPGNAGRPATAEDAAD